MLAKGASIFGVSTLFTTTFAERQDLIREIKALHPDQVPIDRAGLNFWDDERVRDWVRASGRKKLAMAVASGGASVERSTSAPCSARCRPARVRSPWPNRGELSR